MKIKLIGSCLVILACSSLSGTAVHIHKWEGNYDSCFAQRIYKDVALRKIHWPVWQKVNPETTATPSANVKNLASEPVSDVPVVLEIRNLHEPTDFWVDTAFIPSIAAGDSADAYFEEWTSGAHPQSYMTLIYTMLSGDVNPGNDTLWGTVYFQGIYFTACNRQFESQWGTPTLDGVLDTLGEWSDAGKIDISETMGWYGMTGPASCILYALNDSNNLYLGIDYRIDDSLENIDGFLLYFDDDHNGEWHPDSSEGLYGFWYPDSLWYESHTSTAWIRDNPAGFEAIPALTGGRVIYEAKLPLGIRKTDLTTKIGNTTGFFCKAIDKGGKTLYVNGWYPQDWNPDFSPEYMADLKLATPSGTEETQTHTPTFCLELLGSNPVRSKASISFSLPDLTRVKLSVYDLSGRLVAGLADGAFEAGAHRVSWQPGLTTGVYFIRLDGGTKTITRKITVLK